jgi:hypothetical protein
VACPWRKSDVALAELAHIRAIRGKGDPSVSRHSLGVLQTSWCGVAPFIKACTVQSSGVATDKNSASESAHCFATLFKALREQQ